MKSNSMEKGIVIYKSGWRKHHSTDQCFNMMRRPCMVTFVVSSLASLQNIGTRSCYPKPMELVEAKMMFDTLVYRGKKNKGTLERFLTDCQKMFILFDDNTVPSTVRNQIAASSISASLKNNGKKGNKRKHSAHANVVVPAVGPIGYMKPKVWHSKGSKLQKKILAKREKRKVAASHTTVSESSSLTAPPLSIDAPTLERMMEVCAQRVISAT
jgi:hypothetical protein